MAESKKADPPVKSKEKSSLLDIDVDKDFLGSWKSISMGDDAMDFDFGPTTKGTQKSFKFDKMDMDFSLDADFEKLSSFKMDMPGFDISSPTKKSGKSTEKSKEASGGASQSKRETFAFSFDFDEFSNLGFESKKTKIDEHSNKSKVNEGYSNESISGGCGEFLVKDVNASEDDDISLKQPASRGVTNSKVDTQTDNIKDHDRRTEDVNLKSVIDGSSLLKAANSEDQEIQRTAEPIQESLVSEKRNSPEPIVQKVVQDSCVHSEDINICTEGTFLDVQEEESGTLVGKMSPGTGNEQSDVMSVAKLDPTRNFTARMEAQSENGEMCETRDDIVITDHIGGSDIRKADSPLTPGIENSVHEEVADKKNADSSSELQGKLLGSGTTIDELVSDKERGNTTPILSKYFKKQNGGESELQQTSASSTKLISIGTKRTNTLPSNPAVEKREFGSRRLESGSKFTGLSRSLPKVLREDIPVQTENTEASHVKSLDYTRECLNADNIRPRNEPMVTAVSHTISSLKDKPTSKRSDLNSEHINAHRSDVHPSTSTEQLRKNIPLNITNPGTSTHSMRKTVVKENRISPTKAEMKSSELSAPRISRPTDLKLKPSTDLKLKPPNSLLPKDLASMRNKDQSPELQTNMVFKRNLSVDLKKQTSPGPTLKRKTFEESVEIPQLTPLKRLSASPCSNNTKASSEKVAEEQGCNYTSAAHDKSPRLDVSPTEMHISSLEDDGIFEKAEACSKELEDICNMLKKKHEEANDILVRAIVNNNHLLMLNHPIYQDKIRMVQKFAELLMM